MAWYGDPNAMLEVYIVLGVYAALQQFLLIVSDGTGQGVQGGLGGQGMSMH